MCEVRDINGSKNPNWKGGLVEYVCEYCGETAKQKRSAGKKRFCSLVCANKWQSENPYKYPKRRKKRIEKKCRYCGGSFKVLPSRVKKIYFCSSDCQFSWRSERMSGDNNVNWNGGTSTEPYPFVWQERRGSVVERDGAECISPKCRKNSKRINVHHIDYDKDNCQEKNLITLCVSCNARANFSRQYWKDFYRCLLHEKEGYVYNIQGSENGV